MLGLTVGDRVFPPAWSGGDGSRSVDKEGRRAALSGAPLFSAMGLLERPFAGTNDARRGICSTM